MADSSVTNFARWFMAAASAASDINTIPPEHGTGTVDRGTHRFQSVCQGSPQTLSVANHTSSVAFWFIT
uniref:Secreted protein n=1 Tax=Echinococcus granulosus TaxID=6210 RepID=A0A068WW55_ECHGR|nr:hypothetical protein EgrG_002022000 [Echinococcus granulosus]